MLLSPTLVFFDHVTFISVWFIFFVGVFFAPTLTTCHQLGVRGFMRVWILSTVSFVPGFLLFYVMAPKYTQEDRFPARFQWAVVFPALCTWAACGIWKFSALWVNLTLGLTAFLDFVFLWVIHGVKDRFVPSRVAVVYACGALMGVVGMRKASERVQRGFVGVLIGGTNLVMFCETLRRAYLGGDWDWTDLGFLGVSAVAGLAGSFVVGWEEKQVDEGDWEHKED